MGLPRALNPASKAANYFLEMMYLGAAVGHKVVAHTELLGVVWWQ